MSLDLGARARRFAHATGIPRVARDAHLGTLRAIGRARRPARASVDPAHLRILGVSETYLPGNQAGVEITLHTILRMLCARGHTTRALVVGGHAPEPLIDGIAVYGSADGASIAAQFEWADVVLATGGARGEALRAAARGNRPLAFYVQVGNIPRAMLWGTPDLTLFNSEYVRSQYPWITRGLVVHPPIEESDYVTERGEALTLVNLVEAKGGRMLFDLAARMPDRSFLGVRGWGIQAVPDEIPQNVTVVDAQRDMRSVYSRTRILLMPSAYESYGRVALEAAASGIPTIAHAVGGLREALGDAGIWAERNDLDCWVERIRELDDPDRYRNASELARQRFESLDTSQEIAGLEHSLAQLAARGMSPARGEARHLLAAMHRRVLTATARDITEQTTTRRALVLAPHPDDETLACGATIMRKVDAGTAVRVVIVSDGRRAAVARDEDGVAARDHATIRRRECLEACARLGVAAEHVDFLEYEDGALAQHESTLAEQIGAIALEFAPDEVFAPSGIDAHADHRAIARVVGALRSTKLRDTEVLTYPIWFWNRWAWTKPGTRAPRSILDLAVRPILWTLTTRASTVSARGMLGRKRHALDAHASQLDRLDPLFVARSLEDHELFFPFQEPYHR